MLWIKNGCLVDPASKVSDKKDILIEKDQIVWIGESCDVEKELYERGISSATKIDASDCVVAPGLVDVHVHFRDPGFTYKEDIITGAAAAAKGGFTTVVLMANTKPVVDNKETLQYILEKGKETSIHVETCATVTMGLKGEQIVPMKELLSYGAVGFTDDGIPIMREDILREAMILAKEYNVPISLHEEDPSFIKHNGVNSEIADKVGLVGSPREAEISLVKRDLEIALETGANLNVQHISTKEAVELVRQAKKRGSNIHAEATPHHFTLTQEAVVTYGTLAKMNPPLRKMEDKEAVIAGLKDGTINLIATDHAPHSEEEKDKPFAQAPSGILGLETALGLAITNLVQPGHLSIMEVIEKMSTNPAALYQLPAGKIAVGEKADLVIFNPDEKFTVKKPLSKSSNSPFIGEELFGKIHYTIADGTIAYQEEKRMQQKRKETAVVSKQTNIASEIYDMWINTTIAKSAVPGQFIAVFPHNQSTLLPRPISICEVDPENDQLRIVYRIAGKGTKEFSTYDAGMEVSILGNLGNGFPIEEVQKWEMENQRKPNIILMGGGIGIPPMLQLAKEVTGNKHIFVGYRNQETFLKEELEQYGTVHVATEDGSVGVKGNVMDAIATLDVKPDLIFACGPMPMLRAIKAYATKEEIKAFISLEERMACGVGACLGCVCKTKEKDHHSNVNNTRICTDGPVFEAQEVEI